MFLKIKTLEGGGGGLFIDMVRTFENHNELIAVQSKCGTSHINGHATLPFKGLYFQKP